MKKLDIIFLLFLLSFSKVWAQYPANTTVSSSCLDCTSPPFSAGSPLTFSISVNRTYNEIASHFYFNEKNFTLLPGPTFTNGGVLAAFTTIYAHHSNYGVVRTTWDPKFRIFINDTYHSTISSQTFTYAPTGNFTLRAELEMNYTYYPFDEPNFCNITDNSNSAVLQKNYCYANSSQYSSPSNPLLSSNSLTITGVKINQTITGLSPTLNATFAGPVLPFSSSASSGLPVSYSITGPGMIVGNTVSLTGAGIVTLTAYQLGNVNYFPTYFHQIINVSKANQTITGLSPTLNATFAGPVLPFSSSASSGLPVSYSITGPGMIVGNTVSLTGAGIVTLTAYQLGNTNYLPTNFNQIITVSKANQTITGLSPTGNSTFTGTALPFSSSASSGLPVSYSITGPGMIVGNTVSVTGAGIVTLTAYQVGNTNYLPTNFNQIITVSKANQTIIGFNQIVNTTFLGSAVPFSASASSGLAVNFSISGPGAIVGNTVTATDAGIITLTAYHVGNANYFPVSAKQIIIVEKANQTLTGVGPFSDINYLDNLYLTPASSAGLILFRYHASGAVTNIGGGPNVVPTSTGAALVNIIQDGNSNYNPITITSSFTVFPATLTGTVPVQTIYCGPYTLPMVAVTGFRTGESALNAKNYIAPTASSNGSGSTPVGTYVITVSGGSASNYIFKLTNSTLNVLSPSAQMRHIYNDFGSDGDGIGIIGGFGNRPNAASFPSTTPGFYNHSNINGIWDYYEGCSFTIPNGSASGTVILKYNQCEFSNPIINFNHTGNPPEINAYHPKTDLFCGSIITLTGKRFDKIAGMSLDDGDTWVNSGYTIINNSLMTVTVNSGLNINKFVNPYYNTGFGYLRLKNHEGRLSNKINLTFVLPRIYSVQPQPFQSGDLITIFGENLKYADLIYFSDPSSTILSSMSNNSSFTKTQVIVPPNAINSIITVTSSCSFTKSIISLPAKPVLTSILPVKGKCGDVLTINGFNFNNVTALLFNNNSIFTSIPTTITQFNYVNAQTLLVTVTSEIDFDGTVKCKANTGSSNELPFYKTANFSVISASPSTVIRNKSIITVNGIGLNQVTEVIYNYFHSKNPFVRDLKRNLNFEIVSPSMMLITMLGNNYESGKLIVKSNNCNEYAIVSEYLAVENYAWEYRSEEPLTIFTETSSTLNIYPNPSNGVFNVTFSEDGGSLEIFNSLGTTYYESNNSESPVSLKLISILPGIYTVKYTTGNKIHFKKICIY